MGIFNKDKENEQASPENDYSATIAEVQRMGNAFRAFEHAEQVMRGVAKAQSDMRQFEARAAAAKEDLAQAEAQAAEVRANIEADLKKCDAAIKATVTKADAILEGAKAEAGQIVTKAAEDAKAKAADIVASVEADLKAKREEVATLTALVEELTNTKIIMDQKIADANQSIDAIQTQAAKLLRGLPKGEN